jgi:hypothetical protein
VKGCTPTRGSATLRAANIEKPRKACWIQPCPRASALYSGSTAVTSAPAATPARNSAFSEVSVAEAQ